MSLPTRAAIDTPAAAVQAMYARVAVVGAETVSLAQAAGRVLAEDLRSDRESPPCDVSAMDGVALRVADAGVAGLRIAAEVAIGRRPPALPEGAALRIVTGAPLPPGAETVVRIEDVTIDDGRATVRPGVAVPFGGNIRRRGENLDAGALVQSAGGAIDAGLTTALASFGCATVAVHRRVRVAVLVTGDELVEVDGAPDEFQIRDSNGPAVVAALGRSAWLDAFRVPRVADDFAALKAAITGALAGADALILTGGVSMGGKDYVPEALRAVGCEVVFHKLPQRPGQPVLGAVAPGGKAVFGLPGNPLSGLVTARRLVLPTLAKAAGLLAAPPMELVTLDVDPDAPGFDPPAKVWWFKLARRTGPGRVLLVPGRGSGDVVSAARAHGFVEVPPGESGAGPWPFYSW